MPIIKELIDYLDELIPYEALESEELSEELIKKASEEKIPVYKYVLELSKRFSVSEEEIIRKWDDKYSFLAGDCDE